MADRTGIEWTDATCRSSMRTKRDDRLRAVEGQDAPGSTRWHRNPDGPEAAAEIERQAARIKTLEAALRPFADLANAYAEEWENRRAADAAQPRECVPTLGDLRRARAALNPGDPK